MGFVLDQFDARSPKIRQSIRRTGVRDAPITIGENSSQAGAFDLAIVECRVHLDLPRKLCPRATPSRTLKEAMP
jgi:hypothetical protein